MAEGWIKIHRQISDNPLWFSEKFTRGQAWIDMLILANHKDSFFYKRGVKIEVKRGQLGRSEVELSDRWSWSRSKVRKFLNDLEKEQQIEQQKTNVTQLITIINYDKYQQKEQQTEQQKDSKRTAKEQQKDTYKNDNKKETFNFKNELLNLGIEKQIVSDWLKVRAKKKASNTETSFNRIKKQIELSGLTANECIKKAVEKDWKGFEASWLKNLNGSKKEAVKYESEEDKYSQKNMKW
jgi:hypothetical protein